MFGTCFIFLGKVKAKQISGTVFCLLLFVLGKSKPEKYWSHFFCSLSLSRESQNQTILRSQFYVLSFLSRSQRSRSRLKVEARFLVDSHPARPSTRTHERNETISRLGSRAITLPNLRYV